jgi:hypothetical protein
MGTLILYPPVFLPHEAVITKKSFLCMVLLVRNGKGERIGMILAEIQFRQKLYKIIVKGNVVNVVIYLTTNSGISEPIRI